MPIQPSISPSVSHPPAMASSLSLRRCSSAYSSRLRMWNSSDMGRSDRPRFSMYASNLPRVAANLLQSRPEGARYATEGKGVPMARKAETDPEAVFRKLLAESEAFREQQAARYGPALNA